MSPNFSECDALSDVANIFKLPRQHDVTPRRQSIRDLILQQSRFIQLPNFIRISENDLRLTFDSYDRLFFGSSLNAALRGSKSHPIPLKLNGRLRSVGGRTYRIVRNRGMNVNYEIQISSALLFNNFRTPEESVEVTGIPCTDRLDAMMRIMEHEMLHLAEFLAYGKSSCSQSRFQTTAYHLFGHRSHKHEMITTRARTLQSTTIRPGQNVKFIHDGVTLSGVVNRINKRATVLVEHSKGQRYTNGKRYLKFYIPVGALITQSLAE